MGRKHTGSGKYIHVCLAILMCILLSGCATSDEKDTRTGMKKFFNWEFPRTNISSEEQNYLIAHEKQTDNAESLFSAAIIYSDSKNPSRDRVKAIATLKKTESSFPKSVWAYRSNVMSDVLNENLRLKKQLVDTQQENTKLKKQCTDVQQESTKLKEIIEESKKIDIEMDQKKRE